MRRLLRTHLGCIIAASMLSGALSCTNEENRRPRPQASAEVAARRTPIDLVDLDGHAFDLWQPRRAPATVVVFIRSDCPISNRFAPEIRRLHETYAPRGVDFYLIYVDPNERPATIRRHLQEYGYKCEALRDPKHSLVSYCKATRTPEAVVFDRNRTIAYVGRINDQYVALGKARPEPTRHDLADAIESIVLGRPIAMPRTKAIGCPISGLD